MKTAVAAALLISGSVAIAPSALAAGSPSPIYPPPTSASPSPSPSAEGAKVKLSATKSQVTCESSGLEPGSSASCTVSFHSKVVTRTGTVNSSGRLTINFPASDFGLKTLANQSGSLAATVAGIAINGRKALASILSNSRSSRGSGLAVLISKDSSTSGSATGSGKSSGSGGLSFTGATAIVPTSVLGVLLIGGGAAAIVSSRRRKPKKA